MRARHVADLGTGSGAIALALAPSGPHWHLIATDRSAAALQCARANARRLGAAPDRVPRGRLVRAAALARRFDLIVSNPPYVAAADPALEALRYEPAAALSPGRDRHGGAAAPDRSRRRGILRRGGWLVLEHGADQAGRVSAALVAAGYARVRCHRDLAGRERVTEAQWP